MAACYLVALATKGAQPGPDKGAAPSSTRQPNAAAAACLRDQLVDLCAGVAASGQAAVGAPEAVQQRHLQPQHLGVLGGSRRHRCPHRHSRAAAGGRGQLAALRAAGKRCGRLHSARGAEVCGAGHQAAGYQRQGSHGCCATIVFSGCAALCDYLEARIWLLGVLERPPTVHDLWTFSRAPFCASVQSAGSLCPSSNPTCCDDPVDDHLPPKWRPAARQFRCWAATRDG